MSEYFFTHKRLTVETFDADGDLAFSVEGYEHHQTAFLPHGKARELRDWLTKQRDGG